MFKKGQLVRYRGKHSGVFGPQEHPIVVMPGELGILLHKKEPINVLSEYSWTWMVYWQRAGGKTFIGIGYFEHV